VRILPSTFDHVQFIPRKKAPAFIAESKSQPEIPSTNTNQSAAHKSICELGNAAGAKAIYKA
jgi:hypothetical protein